RLTEDVRRDDLALVLTDVGQLPDTVDVSDCPQAITRSQVFVDRHATFLGFHADRFEPQIVHPRPPAGRDEQVVASQLTTVVEHEDVVGAIPSRGGCTRTERDLDAVETQPLTERIT